VVWEKASLMHETYFFPSFITPTGCIFGRIAKHNTLLYVVPTKEVLLTVREKKFEI